MASSSAWFVAANHSSRLFGRNVASAFIFTKAAGSSTIKFHSIATAVAAVTACTALHRTLPPINKQQREGVLCEDAPTKPPQHPFLRKRMTAIGKFTVASETKLNPCVVTVAMIMSGNQPFTANDFRKLWQDRKMMEQHPRFQQRVSKEHSGYLESEILNDNEYNGNNNAERRNKTSVDLHVSEMLFPTVPRLDLKKRLRMLQTATMDVTESLWHVYVAPWGPRGKSTGRTTATTVRDTDAKVTDGSSSSSSSSSSSQATSSAGESVLLFQVHHALADGTSLAAALMDFVDEADEIRQKILALVQKFRQSKGRRQKGDFWQRLRHLWRRMLGFLEGLLHNIAYFSYLKLMQFIEPDPWKILKDFELRRGTVELPDRSISWSLAAPIDQVKWVAEQVGGPKTTVNDVFLSCVAAALSRQLDQHRRRLHEINDDAFKTPSIKVPALPEQKHFHISIPVHLTGGVIPPGQSVGNKIGAIVARLPGETGGEPYHEAAARLSYVHNELAVLKKTPMALLSHLIARGCSALSDILPSGSATQIFRLANAGSIAVVSSNRGISDDHFHIDGRRVETLLGFVPLPPGVPVGVTVLGYAGNITVALSAEPWAVPDADLFLSWILEEYLRLLEIAKTKQAFNTTPSS